MAGLPFWGLGGSALSTNMLVEDEFPIDYEVVGSMVTQLLGKC